MCVCEWRRGEGVGVGGWGYSTMQNTSSDHRGVQSEKYSPRVSESIERGGKIPTKVIQ